MSLSDIYQSEKPALSFELFPPRTVQGVDELMNTVQELSRLEPDFFTCTYGAGGSTRDRTLEITQRIKQEFQIPVASHLTCVGSTEEQLREYLLQAQHASIDYIVALRGDPPKGETHFKPVDGGLRYANELVTLIRSEFPNFGIAVAGYPEVHQECPSPELDLQNLARKVDSGADIIITQLFYDNADFFRFRDRCASVGIDVPIIPGLLPVLSLSQVKKITSLCGAKLPQDFVDRLNQHDSSQWQLDVGVEQAATQMRELLRAGIPGIHFYVLNKFNAISKILDAVSLDPARA